MKPGDLVVSAGHTTLLYVPHNVSEYVQMTGVGLVLESDDVITYVIYAGRVWMARNREFVALDSKRRQKRKHT